jgi:hypothetical protein
MVDMIGGCSRFKQRLAIYRTDGEGVIELLDQRAFVLLDAPGFEREKWSHEEWCCLLRALDDLPHRVVGVEDELGSRGAREHGGARDRSISNFQFPTSNFQSKLCHGELVGVNDVEGLRADEAADEIEHRGLGVARDEKRTTEKHAQSIRSNIGDARTAQRHGVDFGAVGFERGEMFFFLRAHERRERDAMLLRAELIGGARLE